MLGPKRHWLVSLVAMFLLIVSMTAGYQELDAFRGRWASVAGTSTATATTSSRNAIFPALDSRLARRARLDTCRLRIETLKRRNAAMEAIHDAERDCLALSESIVGRAPLSSNEWFVAATLASSLGDIVRMRKYLAASYRTGPTEQWIAERRAFFTHEHAAQLPAMFQTLVDQDVLLMLKTETGIRTVAKRYVSDPALRQRLVDVALTLEPGRQQRFVDLVRVNLASDKR